MTDFAFGGGANDGLIGGGPMGGAGDVIKDTTTESFIADVIEASKTVPVIVDFWAPWCGPCKQLTPILEKVVRAANGAVRLVKLNIDENPQVAQQLRIQSIPTVYAFKGGQPVDGFMGAVPESQVRTLVERLAGAIGPTPGEVALDAAKKALEAGDLATAAQTFARLLQDTPGDPDAIAGLARTYLAAGDSQRAEDTLALTPPEARNAQPIVSVQALLSLAKETGAAGDPAALEQRLAANPKDHEARYELALVQIARGEPDKAVEGLLEIMRLARSWNDDAARKKLLMLFDAFGPEDELTISGRRRLSSILFS